MIRGGWLTFVLLINFLQIDFRDTECKMAKTGLLLVSNFSKIPSLLGRVSKYVSQTLYISVSDTDVPVVSQSEWVTGIYNQATRVCHNLDVRVLLGNFKDADLKRNIKTIFPIDIVMLDNQQFAGGAGDSREDIKCCISKLRSDFDILRIENELLDGSEQAEEKKSEQKMFVDKIFDYSALGGTFDRIHNGHKILLSEGIIRTLKELTVGVTDVNMIKSKKLWELIEPVDVRIETLKLLLADIDPTLKYNVVPIQDAYGPTKDDGKLQLLIVSEETMKGGDMVNKKRAENQLPEMAIHCIGLVKENELFSQVEELKVSSSNRRMRLLGSTLKEPRKNANLPSFPYVIGLTGGIASGKTNITEKLRDLGAGIVNCDLLAHELYKPGAAMNLSIAEVFGKDVISANGEVDRKKLGSIVFNDPSRLIELNNLLWPAILDEAKKRVSELGREGFKVVVMEAAVLIQAGWSEHCHQVWTSIIPPEEAVRRIMDRNKLSEADAKARVSSQPSNSEQVALANIVFSSLWDYDVTAAQVVKAWNNLSKYLVANKL